ncbi:MAG: nucleotidyl transferase AbiEii/AbiGii toxin family protein [Raineya sp.]|jgi:hypothetical protein|nr:nucleotidyl transferase AbiEii/AbiGii toxin family protein [Raineya sp.]
MNKDYKLHIKACEAFIRRASKLKASFILKGSYLSRQFFQNPEYRIPKDLDWIYHSEILKNEVLDREDAKTIFRNWVNEVIALDLQDDIIFEFKNQVDFWEISSYQYYLDFRTLGTSLKCSVKDKVLNSFPLEISFNKQLDDIPEPIFYKPFQGKPFVVPHVAPLSLQISWKIHQCLIDFRFKDIFDLIHLLKSPMLNDNILWKMLQALVNECFRSKTPLDNFKYFLRADLRNLSQVNIDRFWNHWRFDNYSDCASKITDINLLPTKLYSFEQQLEESLEIAGLKGLSLKDLPEPTITK